jgi:threonine dehydrogenase-like Zn-dependent dehydrogenase
MKSLNASSMCGLIVQNPGELALVEVPKPVPGPLEVLARVSYCGICGTDMAIYTGDSNLVRSGQVQYPVAIGHEWSGVVEETGLGVVNVRPGDRVVSVDGIR